MSFNRTTEGC